MTMIPSLQTFTRALLTPDLSFKTLTDAQALTDCNGLPALTRSSHFAEARIVCKGGQYLLSMPLTSAALPRIERAASQLRRLTTPWLNRYRILPGELCWSDPMGEGHATDLVLEEFPAGRDFDQALLTEEEPTLLAALDALQAALRTLDFTHNNLKGVNLRWVDGRFVPLRYHDARIGGPEATDNEAFDALRAEIRRSGGRKQTVGDVEATYSPLPSFPGHLWTSSIFEGLVLVQDESGFGYVDTSNNPVIAPRFRWAGDFREGRAEVETEEGMGLIDRAGNYVIPASYEIVDYCPAQSVVRVRQNGRWALFDLLGRRLTEFGMKFEA